LSTTKRKLFWKKENRKQLRKVKQKILQNRYNILIFQISFSSGSGYGPVAGSCEHGNEPSASTKGGEFLD
jgi:hypothetical protein